ncbi:MAG TPA: N-acetylmuramoyl-L-alanine amidase-like domain-containing protein [Ignavibacteria bacterium]|nr:N-acetylmuramoyl-L-alanine amidase-like domain-containing protein [Ignavibacteria bacterium]
MRRINHYKSAAIIFTVILMLVPFGLNSGTDDDYEIKAVKKKLKSFDRSLSDSDISDIIITVGKSFIGTEYVAGTLDKNTKSEKLVIKISGLDCVTFVENTLAISRIIKRGNFDFDSYKDELTKIRYRDGEINGYSSRLHYFTDWIYDNEKKGIVSDITKSIGGIPYYKTINFMSSHADSYKQLADNSDIVDEMKDIEKKMNRRDLYYIKKSEVDDYYESLQSGDIIATTTNIEGLDVTHTGFIYKKNGKTHFLHASITKGEIIISKEELKEYLKGNKKQTGIIVARPQ